MPSDSFILKRYRHSSECPLSADVENEVKLSFNSIYHALVEDRWPTWWLVRAAMNLRLKLSRTSQEAVKRWYITHHFWGSRDAMITAVNQIRLMDWGDFCVKFSHDTPEKGKRLNCHVQADIEFCLAEHLSKNPNCVSMIQKKETTMSQQLPQAQNFYRVLSIESGLLVRTDSISPKELREVVQKELAWQSQKAGRLVLLYSSKTGKTLPVQEVSKILANRVAKDLNGK